MRKRTWNIEKLPEAVKRSTCWAEVCRYLGRPAGGSSQATLIRWSKKLNLDTSHFQSDEERLRGLRTASKKKRIPNDQMFIEQSLVPRNLVRNRIIKDNLLEYKCSMCDNVGEWLGQKMSLQIDHVNGVSNDHRLQNLRWLCPNCHSITPTYAGKNRTEHQCPVG